MAKRTLRMKREWLEKRQQMRAQLINEALLRDTPSSAIALDNVKIWARWTTNIELSWAKFRLSIRRKP